MLAFLPILCGDIPWSASGLMRCFEIVAPEGTLVNATFPAAINRAPLGTGWTIGNLASQCLSQMLDRAFEFRSNVQASCCGTFDFACVAGVDQRAERPIPFLNVVMETVAGGYGARPARDGINTGGSFCIPMGRVPDAEITELLYPLLILWRREEQDSGGAGRQRGGSSCAVAMTPHGTSIPAHVIMASSGKATAQNPGLAGGYPGNLGHDLIVHGARVDAQFASGSLPTSLSELSGNVEISQCYAQSVLEPGDVLYMNCQGGGGYGDPILRDPQSVGRDYGEGSISLASGRDVYGVVLQEDGTVDSSATTKRRAQIRDSRRREMTVGSPLQGTADIEGGQPIDDNLTLASAGEGTRIACRHCAQVLGDEANVLHVGVLEGESCLAGPIVRSQPGLFIDAPVAFRQLICPGCGVALHTSIAPKGQIGTVNGFAVSY
jgi:N-methylhydantoinase B